MLVKTTPELAYNILEAKNRKIKATNGGGLMKVISINRNNMTFQMSRLKGHEITQNCEDYVFWIVVPKNAKSIY